MKANVYLETGTGGPLIKTVMDFEGNPPLFERIIIGEHRALITHVIYSDGVTEIYAMEESAWEALTTR